MVRCPNCQGKFYTVPVRCHSRFCRPCSRARAAKWTDRADGLHWHDPHMLTLTSIAGPDALGMVALVLWAFAKFRRSMELPAGIRSIELKESRHGWYVHVHCLVDGWVDIVRAREVWQNLTGAVQCRIDWVNGRDPEAVRAAIREVVKYSTKGFKDRLTAAQPQTGGPERYTRAPLY